MDLRTTSHFDLVAGEVDDSYSAIACLLQLRVHWLLDFRCSRLSIGDHTHHLRWLFRILERRASERDGGWSGLPSDDESAAGDACHRRASVKVGYWNGSWSSAVPTVQPESPFARRTMESPKQGSPVPLSGASVHPRATRVRLIPSRPSLLTSTAGGDDRPLLRITADATPHPGRAV